MCKDIVDKAQLLDEAMPLIERGAFTNATRCVYTSRTAALHLATA